LGFFNFGILILEQSISVLVIAKNLKGVQLGLKVLVNDIKAILIKLSLICGNNRAKGIKGARSAKG
jgi:hypothetical protein